MSMSIPHHFESVPVRALVNRHRETGVSGLPIIGGCPHVPTVPQFYFPGVRVPSAAVTTVLEPWQLVPMKEAVSSSTILSSSTGRTFWRMRVRIEIVVWILIDAGSITLTDLQIIAQLTHHLLHVSEKSIIYIYTSSILTTLLCSPYNQIPAFVTCYPPPPPIKYMMVFLYLSIYRVHFW